jgi:release factor glutamine methyltransferase
VKLDEWFARERLPRLDAQVLAMSALGLTRTELITRGDMPLDEAALASLNALARRAEFGEPIAYITGRKEFYSLELEVSRATLIPRPDTEILVDRALDILRGLPHARVLDLGSGTGAIALAIAAHAPQAQVTAAELSSEACALIERNAAAHGLNVQVLQSDWFSALDEDAQFDVILSNPPYVREDDPHLAALRFEPKSALTSGPDGLRDIRIIIEAAPAHLLPGASLWLEHGYDQVAAVRGLLENAGFSEAESLRDLGGNWRCSGGRMP